jgi:hypothetical protein
MGARQKLNEFYFLVSVFWAAVIGAATRSWAVFFIALVILVLCSLHSGGIRPRPGH